MENLSVVDTPRSLGRHVSGWSKSRRFFYYYYYFIFFIFFNFYPSFRCRKLPIITPLLITPPPPHPFIGPSTCKQKYASRYRLPPNICPTLACIKMNLTFYDLLLSCARAPLSQVTNNAHNGVFFFILVYRIENSRTPRSEKFRAQMFAYIQKCLDFFDKISARIHLDGALSLSATLTFSFIIELTGL